MSAYIVSDKTINAIIYGARTFGRENLFHGFSPWGDADIIGQALVDENYRSVNYRYDEHDEPHRYHYPDAGGCGVLVIVGEDEQYRLGEVYGALRCYRYQSCEHPEWPESDVCRWLNALEGAICRTALERLGEEIPWGIE